MQRKYPSVGTAHINLDNRESAVFILSLMIPEHNSEMLFRYWLFGEKIQHNLPAGEESLLRTRGWFPRRCAVELIENNEDDVRPASTSQHSISEKKIE